MLKYTFAEDESMLEVTCVSRGAVAEVFGYFLATSNTLTSNTRAEFAGMPGIFWLP